LRVGIIGRLGRADLCIGCRHEPFRRGDVRPALEQRRRHVGRGDRDIARHRRRCDREFSRRLADQRGDRMLELSTLHADGDRLCARRLELGLGSDDNRPVLRRHRILVTRDLKGLGEGDDSGVEQPLQLVRGAQIEIVGGQRRLRRQPRRDKIGGARLCVRDVALDGAADFCPRGRGLQVASAVKSYCVWTPRPKRVTPLALVSALVVLPRPWPDRVAEAATEMVGNSRRAPAPRRRAPGGKPLLPLSDSVGDIDLPARARRARDRCRSPTTRRGRSRPAARRFSIPPCS